MLLKLKPIKNDNKAEILKNKNIGIKERKKGTFFTWKFSSCTKCEGGVVLDVDSSSDEQEGPGNSRESWSLEIWENIQN